MSPCLLVGLGSFSWWNTHFRGISSSINLFKYFDALKLIHDPWYRINRPNTVVWKTSPYHDFCAIMLHCIYTVLWLQFRTWGSSEALSMTARPEKNNFTLTTPQNVRLFLFGPTMCSLAKFNRFCTCRFGVYRAFLLMASIKHLLTAKALPR